MSAQIIPLTTSPNQSMQMVLNIDGKNKRLQLTVRFNEIGKYWVIGIIDVSTGEYLLDSIPLLTGIYPAANILGQYAYLGIGGLYLLNVSNTDKDWPDNTDLGSDYILCWTDTSIPALPSSPYNFPVTTFGFDFRNAFISGFDLGCWDARSA